MCTHMHICIHTHIQICTQKWHTYGWMCLDSLVLCLIQWLKMKILHLRVNNLMVTCIAGQAFSLPRMNLCYLSTSRLDPIFCFLLPERGIGSLPPTERNFRNSWMKLVCSKIMVITGTWLLKQHKMAVFPPGSSSFDWLNIYLK